MLGSDRKPVPPWGSWLRVFDSSVEDAEGRRWRSVRQAFWEGHLGFPPTHLASEQVELLTRVLVAIDHNWINANEHRHDLFGGAMLFWRFYQCWLSSIGLLEAGPRVEPLSATLSDEGRSVMAMLQATREPAWVDLPFNAVVDIVRGAGRGVAEEDRERALRAFERSVASRPQVFAREFLNGAHLVTLTILDLRARMPMLKVVWSQGFVEESVRDDFFAWLAMRVGRWEDWAEIAYRTGADALTRHLLGLLAAGLSTSQPTSSSS